MKTKRVKWVKFQVGQVVAIWKNHKVPQFYRISSFYWDGDDVLRYKFESRSGDSLAESLCPIEALLRPLTARERGPKRPAARGK